MDFDDFTQGPVSANGRIDGGCAFLPFRAHSIRLHARDSAKGLIMPTPAEMKAKKLKQKQATLLSTSRDMATVRMAASMHVSETQNRRLARGHYSSLPLAHLTGDLLADSPGISPEASGRRKSSKEGLDQLMQVRHRELSSPVCRTFDHDSTVAPFCQPLHREWKNQPLAISMLHPLVQKFLRFACAIPHVALARAQPPKGGPCVLVQLR